MEKRLLQFIANTNNLTLLYTVLFLPFAINVMLNLYFFLTWHQSLGENETNYIQSNIHLQPPLISDYLPLQLSAKFSKIPKVSQSNPYILNLLEATTSLKWLWLNLELNVWHFLLLLSSFSDHLRDNRV